MNLIDFFNPKKTLKLFGLENEFNFFKNLLLKEKLPKVLLISGKKGSGKYTLINHLMFFFFDRKNYDSNSMSKMVLNPRKCSSYYEWQYFK